MTHVNLSKQHQDAYGAVIAFDATVREAVTSAGLDPKLAELVEIRVSQINECAFCLRMHTRDALALGETTDRLAVVAAWWESQYFSKEERRPSPWRRTCPCRLKGRGRSGERTCCRRSSSQRSAGSPSS